ncbi:MAG: L-seryl-tRNA(Sec) selenium transferase [Dorea sp.]|nr:L-seryl-tRNA(Sec) selenium transferase [Dorea sp.]
MNKNLLYRSIPKVDVLLEKEEIKVLISLYGRELVLEAIHTVMRELRSYIGKIEEKDPDNQKVISQMETAKTKIDQISTEVESCLSKMVTPNMRPVINATGTILHTNLGRALISEKHAKRLVDLVTGYSNLEYNLEAGKRGERYSHFEKLLCKLTGAEAAMAVNNNAAAVMLVLSSMAEGGEVIVSRGELVEIGGKFRVPDVMEQSGAILREIGTTNKTHFSDYEEAVSEHTKAFLKVHTSNYRIIGFTESVPVAELSKLSKETGIPVIEDLGSGVLVDLSKYGLTYEPTVQDSIRDGADVVCFSGDKLLGGPQAGIIIGKKKYIDRMKKNQLTRALRIDKFTAAALELVLTEYLCEEKAVENIPVLRMIRESLEDVGARAERLKVALCEKLVAADGQVKHMGCQNLTAIGLEPCESQIGGGSLPLERIPSMALAIKPWTMTVNEMEEAMRGLEIPIIGRAYNDKIYLDMRTVLDKQVEVIAEELANLLSQTPPCVT